MALVVGNITIITLLEQNIVPSCGDELVCCYRHFSNFPRRNHGGRNAQTTIMS